PLPKIDDPVLAMTAAPDGTLLFYRTIDPYTAQSSLWLVDPRDAAHPTRIAADGVPGRESLHPIFGRDFDLTADLLAFVAEETGRDQIFLRPYSHRAEPSDEKWELAFGEDDWRSEISVGAERTIPLGKHGLISAQ